MGSSLSFWPCRLIDVVAVVVAWLRTYDTMGLKMLMGEKLALFLGGLDLKSVTVRPVRCVSFKPVNG